MPDPSLFGLAGVRRLVRLPWRTPRQIASDVDAEIAFHLEARCEALVAGGQSPDAARLQAEREFGDVDAARRALREQGERHEHRSRWRTRWTEWWQDVRHAVRACRRAPGFALTAALTLAVGIGASTALFAVVDGVLLKPLPYGEPERLVMVWQRRGGVAEREELASATFLDLRERTRTLAQVAAAEPSSVDLQTVDGVESLRAWLVTDGFFELLGATARLGRTFRSDEYASGRDRVVVLADALWRRRFGADPAVVGRTLTLDGAPHLVVGVMPPTFRLPAGRELWVPKVITPAERARRGAGFWLVVGRLAPGVSLASAGADAAGIGRLLSAEHPRTQARTEFQLVPLDEELLAGSRPALLLLLGAAGVVLAVACANVASLTLTRALGRARELSVRAALGAGRGRIARLLLAESAVLAAAGGVVGAGLAWALVHAIRVLGPADVPRLDTIALDVRALGFASVVSAAMAIGCAVLPARTAAHGDLQARLRAGGRGSTASGEQRWARAGLVVAEVALSVALLVGAGLLVRSFVRLIEVDRGFRTEGVLALTVQAWQHYPEAASRVVYARDVTARLAALPGVRAAGVTSSLPLAEAIGQDEAAFTPEGQPIVRDADAPTAHVTVASERYLDVLGIVLRRGRSFTAADDARGTPVALISEALARRHFPGVDPVGRTITLGFGGAPRARRIVGVVGDVRQTGIAADPGAHVYLPHAQAPTGALVFVVRVAGDPAAMLDAARRALGQVNRAVPIASATTAHALVAAATRERRFQLALLGAFAVTALGLAAVGLYGLLSDAVAQRQREFGVRFALGATAGDVLLLVMRESGVLVSVGLVTGLGLAMHAAERARALLFQVSPADPVTLALVASVVIAVAIAASMVPALRAVRVGAATVLRDG